MCHFPYPWANETSSKRKRPRFQSDFTRESWCSYLRISTNCPFQVPTMWKIFFISSIVKIWSYPFINCNIKCWQGGVLKIVLKVTTLRGGDNSSLRLCLPIQKMLFPIIQARKRVANTACFHHRLIATALIAELISQ